MPDREARKMSNDLKPEDILEWLKGNPDFLPNHPEAIRYLRAPVAYQEDKTVVDFQKVMVEKLRKDNADIIETQYLLVQNSRANLNNQTRIHAAVLNLLDATSFEELIHIITSDLSITLDVDVVGLVIESDSGTIPHQYMSGVKILQKGSVDHLMGGQKIILQPNIKGIEHIFGAAAGLVHSQALIRLDIHTKAPVGILAFGSRNPEYFVPDQGTELVAFLARVVERCIRAWLTLPS